MFRPTIVTRLLLALPVGADTEQSSSAGRELPITVCRPSPGSRIVSPFATGSGEPDATAAPCV